MERIKRGWKGIPTSIRKPLVLVVGLIFVIASPFTGVLPGPGGIPIFLIGIAILASEFEWAQRIRDPIVEKVHEGGQAWRRHKAIGTLIIIFAALVFASLSYYFYTWTRDGSGEWLWALL